MEYRILKQSNAATRERRAHAIVTQLGDGRQRLVLADQPLEGALGKAIKSTLRSGQSQAVSIENERFFLEACLPAPRLLIVGAVHIAQALAPMATIAGLEVTVVDPRPAFATQDRFDANQRIVCDWPDDYLEAHPLDAYSALACYTHEPNIDDKALTHALEKECFYIGALGGSKSHGKRLKRLKEAGFSDEVLDTIQGPIGLDIGSSTPAEIAIATLAQIIQHLRLPKT